MERLAFDRASARSLDENGFLHVEMCNISKEAVNDYYGHEIPHWEDLGLDPNKIYRGYRPAEELEKAVKTFNMLPLLDEHIEDSADDPKVDHRVGNLGSLANFKRPYLRNALVIQRADAIENLNPEDPTQDAIRELSSSYRYDPDFTPGTFNGEKYDFVMRNIRGNHVAIVHTGRAGSDVVVADANPFKRGKRFMVNLEAAEIFVNAAKELGLVPHPGGASEAKQIIRGEEKAMQENKAVDQDPVVGQTEGNTSVAVDMSPEEAKEKLFEVLDGIQDRGLADNLIMLFKAATGPAEAVGDKDPDAAEDNVTCVENEPRVEDKGKPAMDKKSVMAQDAAAIERRINQSFKERIEAAEVLAPLVSLSPLAYDSAAAMYKAGLKAYGSEPKTNDPAALREIVAARIEVLESGAQAKVRQGFAAMAQDAAPSPEMEDLAKSLGSIRVSHY